MFKKIFRSLLLSLLIISCVVYSQEITERYKDLGEIFILELASAPFPHPARMDGHKYKDETYSYLEHYKDSSVAVFIPKRFEPATASNIVVYFHGWYNNIDTACSQFNLIEQFSQSNKNAIFIFPEGPKNSPDSFGGKLEEENGLIDLVNHVLTELLEKEKLSSTNIGNIILAGHSGAYRVISFCLKHGGLTSKVSDVILFDALYANTELYTTWIENYNGRFINIYTDNGGTKSKTEIMMNSLESKGIKYFMGEEIEVNLDDLFENRLIFIHSDLTHNDVISERDQFLNYLKTSKLQRIE
jgi:hypothetical protein